MRQFKIVDAFSATPLRGNPVAVVLDGTGIDDAQMAAIARWMNLSETTFVLPPTSPHADYRVRIFSPMSELPFAGHPTLGTAHAVLQAGIAKVREGKVVQECGVGMVDIGVTEVDGQQRLALTLPPAKITALSPEEASEMEAILGHALVANTPPAVINVGAVWAVAQFPTVEILLSLTPDFARSIIFERRLGLTGLSVFAVDPVTQMIETRSFAPSCGANEDPVCGSGNGSIAVFRMHNGMLPSMEGSYTARQGRKLGRDGEVLLSAGSDGVVRVGGVCVTTVEGALNL